jgi:primosomal protein N' (replication factor Y)
VLPDVAAIDRAFDYLVPEDIGAAAGVGVGVGVGTIVRIPLHGRRVGGWVIADEVEPPAGVELRAIAKVTGHGPSAELVELSAWAAHRWAGRRGAFLRTASPPVAVRHVDSGVVRGRKPAPNHSIVMRLAPGTDRWPLIEGVVEGGPALVLVPSSHEAEVLAGRLRRSGQPVALLPGDWAAAAAGGVTVVGSRAAAWGPAPDVATIVVLDAHDETYHEERAPTWDAVTVAHERAVRRGIPFVAVSPCPTIDLLELGALVVPDRAAERAGWPRLQVVDRRGDDPRAGLYSRSVVDAIRSGGRVVCVLNRKGRVKLLACAACGATVRCERCATAVEDTDAGTLRCRQCRLERPRVCGDCGAGRLKALRVGVTRAREELDALAPGVEVGEVTGDREGIPDVTVLVGTEAVLHRVPRADVVAFLDFDQELLAPRYRAAEEALALLARAARIVGGRHRDGRVLVQTRLPDHEVLDAAAHADPGRHLDGERERRRALGLPPFRALALLSGDAAAAYAAGLAGAEAAVEVAGPSDGRWLVRAADHDTLATALAGVPRPAGRLRIEVDPLRT